MRAVFVGTNEQISELVALALQLRWPDATIVVASTAKEGLHRVEQEVPDTVFLCPAFNDLTLAETIQGMRKFSNAALVVLGEGDEIEIIASLESGADDYITLPCGLTEVMAKTWVALRRVQRTLFQEKEEMLRIGQLVVDPATYRVFIGRRRVQLTTTEFRLLYLLVKNRQVTVTRSTIEQTLWGEHADGRSTKLVHKYIQHLRKKLGDSAKKSEWIANMHGVGYKFIGPPTEKEEIRDE